MDYKIDKGIAFPQVRNNSKWKELIMQMEIGDSVLFDTMKPAHDLYQALYARKIKASTRKCENGWRVWRVA